MASITAERDRLLALLATSGLRVTDDPRVAKSPPVVFLTRPSCVPLGNNCENLRIQWTLHLITKSPDNSVSWDRLEEMREAVWHLLKNQITTCDPDTYQLNETTEAAAYRITFETVI